MELFQMETFLAVAEERGFSRAAKRLHRTQSAISQTISKLEDELGEVLFERSMRDGTLTDAGRLLQEYAEELLNVRGAARQALRELRTLQHGKLSIAANELTSLYLLPLLDRYVRLHPQVKIEIRRTLGSEVQRRVLNHTVELGLLSFQPDDSSIESTVIFVDRLEFVVPPSHPLATVKNLSIRELGAQSFIAHNVLSPYRDKVVETFRRCKTPLPIVVELPTIEAIKQFVAMGHGVAIIPAVSVSREIQRGELVSIPVKELQFERKIRLVHRQGAALSHAARAFMRICEAFANDGVYQFQKEKLVFHGANQKAAAKADPEPLSVEKDLDSNPSIPASVKNETARQTEQA